MNVIVVSDAHLFKTPDNKYWCNTAMHGYNFWKRYLLAFDKIIVVARVKSISLDEASECNYISAEGDNIEFFDLPFIRGIKGYLFGWNQMRKACKRVVEKADRAIFRVPSIPAYFALNQYKKSNKPFALEVVIDPEDEYKSIPVLKKISVQILKNACKNANGVSYVTKDYLEKKYPSGKRLGIKSKEYFESYYSSIDLDEDFFFYERTFNCKKNTIEVLHIANSINNENKGHRTVIEIIYQLRQKGIEAHTTFIGSGDRIEVFKNLCRELMVDDLIDFVGYISDKSQIKEYLKNAELFVFPSKAEGLPRVLIEAMATGLPCVASDVDGIPELIDKEYLFRPTDVLGFTQKIKELAGNNEKLREMSLDNIKRAEEYRAHTLNMRRKEFYSKLRNY